MSGAVLDRPPMTAPDETPVAHVPAFEDRLPQEWKWSRRLAGSVLVLGLVFAWYGLKPLWHTDVWGHLSYGRWIATHGALPATEPLLPLSTGMRFVDTAWLFQVVGYLTHQALGVAGLLGLSSVLVTAMGALVLHRCYERTRIVGMAYLGVVLFVWLDATTLAIMRPQLAGLLCFCALLHRLTSPRPTRADWVLVPALHLVWANLHGSFVLGLALQGAFVLGRAVDLLRHAGTVRAIWHDAKVRRLLAWLELSAVAALVNPYGLGLYLEVLQIGSNANLQSLTEWQTLDVRAPHGWFFVASVVVLVALYRFTPRRIATWEVFTLVGLAFASLWSARFLSWWGPVAAVLAVTHLHAALRRWLPWRAEPVPSVTSGKWTIVTLGLVWIFVGYSPLGMRLLHHKDPVLERSVSELTPLGATQYLLESPPQGLVFNTYEWGDYLQWAGPTGMQLFVNSHAHLAPREVWQSYLHVVEQTAGWEDILDRFGVNTVVVDTMYREPLIRRLKDNPAWKVGYQDSQAVVFVRKAAI